jgi:hypothetical protein
METKFSIIHKNLSKMFWVLDQGIDAQQHGCGKSTPQYKLS